MNRKVCAQCGATDPTGLSRCPWCGGSGVRSAADTLVFLQRPAGFGKRAMLRGKLEDLLDGMTTSHALRPVLGSRRPLVAAPGAGAREIVERLSASSVPAVAINGSDVWKRLPRGFTWMVLWVIAFGAYAGLSSAPMFLWLTPIYAALLVAGAVHALRQPLIENPKAETSLPRKVERRVATALGELRGDRSRELLGDLVRLARVLYRHPSSNSGERFVDVAETVRTDLRDLLVQASDLALQLDRLDETVRILDESEAEVPDSDRTDVLARCVEVRERLDAKLSEAIVNLGRAERLSADTPAGAADQIGEAARSIERHFHDQHEAQEEIAQLLGES